MLLLFSECQKIPYRHGKRTETKSLKSISAALRNYEELNKAVHKWFLILRSENVPISGLMLKEKALKFAEGSNIEGFQASEGWLEKWKKR